MLGHKLAGYFHFLIIEIPLYIIATSPEFDCFEYALLWPGSVDSFLYLFLLRLFRSWALGACTQQAVLV